MSECNNCEGESQNKNLKGPRGLRGEIGPQGIPGPASASVVGPQGPQGIPGIDGNNGATGLSAYEVWLMLPGNAGKTEAEFITDITGAAGTPPNFVVGTVTAGATPGVTAVTVGTTCTLNFVLAQGPTGPTGSTGPAGPQGNPGPNSLVYKRIATPATNGGWSDNTGGYETLTVININKTSLLGYTGAPAVALNASDWNLGIVINSCIQITSRVDSSKFGIYKVLAITDNTSYMTYSVLKIAANGSSSTINEEATISYNVPGIDTVNPASVTIPIGVIWPTGTKNGKALPGGWLLCDGSPYAIVTYPALFAEIGLDYAQPGDPLTVFRVPDLIDKVPYGCVDGNVGNDVGNNTLSALVSGTASVTVGIANIPSHVHSLASVDGATVNITSSGDHIHTILRSQGATGTGANDRADANNQDSGTFSTGVGEGNHTHPTSSFAGNTAAAGGSGSPTPASGTINGLAAGDNRQKGLSLRFMIKY
jgi:microcystin-dependent protein